MSQRRINTWRLTGVLLLALAPEVAHAQSGPARPQTFAAVSIKISSLHTMRQFQADPAGLHIASYTLRQLIDYAYGIDDFQIAGWVAAMRSGDWTQWRRFNVDATTSVPATDAELRLMLQNVLQSRFGLHLRRDSKVTPLLALVAAPHGVTFKPLGSGSPRAVPSEPGMVTVHMGTITVLINRLNLPDAQQTLKRPVIDQTGLTGDYDLGLTLPVDDVTVSGGPARSSFEWGKLPEALKREGLELKPVTLPYDTYAIESAHEPTAN